MVRLDNADVMAMEVLSEVVELLELARHSAVARHQTVSQQVLVHSRICEVAAQSLVVQRVVAQCCRVRIEIGIRQIEVKVLLCPPRLYSTRSPSKQWRRHAYNASPQLPTFPSI